MATESRNGKESFVVSDPDSAASMDENLEPLATQFLKSQGRRMSPERVLVYDPNTTQLAVRGRKSIEKFEQKQGAEGNSSNLTSKLTSKAGADTFRKFSIAKDCNEVTLLTDAETSTDIKIDTLGSSKKDRRRSRSRSNKENEEPRTPKLATTPVNDAEAYLSKEDENNWEFLARLHLNRMGTFNRFLQRAGKLSTLYVFR